MRSETCRNVLAAALLIAFWSSVSAQTATYNFTGLLRSTGQTVTGTFTINLAASPGSATVFTQGMLGTPPWQLNFSGNANVGTSCAGSTPYLNFTIQGSGLTYSTTWANKSFTCSSYVIGAVNSYLAETLLCPT